MRKKTSTWVKYSDMDELEKYGWEHPGIYVIAKSEKNISGQKFDYIKEIVYFGITNSPLSLKVRLSQFDYTLCSRHSQHCVADKFISELGPKIEQWKRKLYVALIVFPLDDRSTDLEQRTPEDLKTMGELAKQEYVCLYEYKTKFGKIPRFNNQSASLKTTKHK